MDEQHTTEGEAQKRAQELDGTGGEWPREGKGSESVPMAKRRAERWPDEGEACTRQAMDRLPAIYAVYDAERHIRFVNRFGLRLSGRREEEIVGCRDEQVFPAEITACYLPVLQRAFELGRHQHAQISLPESLGGRTALIDCAPIHDENGRLAQVLLVGTDTTRYKKVEQRLRRLNEALEQQVWQRTEQLRTLTLELSRAHEQERQRIAQELHENLQQALAAGQVQLGLGRQAAGSGAWKYLDRVDAMLQESMRISRDLTTELSPPILCDADLSLALEWLGHWMEGKHRLPVQVTIGDEIEMPDDGLRIFLFRAAKEMLLYAVEQARATRARLNLEQRGEEVWLTVQYPAESANAGGSAESQGAAALASIRERTEYLGGHMDILHTLARGTTITLRVSLVPDAPEPRRESAAGGETPAPDALLPTPKIRVLIADDHRILRQGLAMVLQNEPDITVVGEADNGQEALELARQLSPDVVLMDMSMPLMDGVQATERIRQDLPDTQVIGLSMYTEKAMMARMRAAGVSAYVNKSGDPAELLRIVRKVGGGRVG